MSDYRKITPATRAAFFAYKKASPGQTVSVVAFVAGYNSAPGRCAPVCHKRANGVIAYTVRLAE